MKGVNSLFRAIVITGATIGTGCARSQLPGPDAAAPSDFAAPADLAATRDQGPPGDLSCPPCAQLCTDGGSPLPLALQCCQSLVDPSAAFNCHCVSDCNPNCYPCYI